MDVSIPPQGSPMVAAYAAARAAAPGHLVLYRVGEFYEVLGDDAAVVSRLLGIQLTRWRQKDTPDIPMCGIPAGTAEAAIARLLAAGRKVAVSEQPSEPAGPRPLRRMTPGTSVDADVLAAGRPNTLAVTHAEGETVALAWTDLSTGEGGTCMASLGGCTAALARIVPSEILVSRWPAWHLPALDRRDPAHRDSRQNTLSFCHGGKVDRCPDAALVELTPATVRTRWPEVSLNSGSHTRCHNR